MKIRDRVRQYKVSADTSFLLSLVWYIPVSVFNLLWGTNGAPLDVVRGDERHENLVKSRKPIPFLNIWNLFCTINSQYLMA